MPLLRAPRHSLQDAISPRYVPYSRGLALSAQDAPSRHDAQMLNVRAVPADPYTVWRDQREADRRSSAVSEPTTPYHQFIRNQPTDGAQCGASGQHARA
jgi:hypothetical protein